jgi:hypothetical protein
MVEQQDSGISFGAFVISLATTAAVHFGDIADPATGTPHPTDLTAARQMIDILGMLQAKTQGNLDPEERKLLDDLLYELRLRFVEAQKNEKRIITP